MLLSLYISIGILHFLYSLTCIYLWTKYFLKWDKKNINIVRSIFSTVSLFFFCIWPFAIILELMFAILIPVLWLWFKFLEFIFNNIFNMFKWIWNKVDPK
jgi:hypothetical protein